MSIFYPGCKHLGQFLNDGYDSCSYLVCGYGNEPWKDAYGNIAFFTDRQHCAPGTAVSKGYYGGYGNPCSEASYECNPPGKKSTGLDILFISHFTLK